MKASGWGSLLKKRFLAKVNKTKTCWLWTGTNYHNRRKAGSYGKIEICRKEYSAHRVSWIIFRGEIPENMCVLHKCDNPPCVKPSHLWIGTMGENCTDRARKGRNNHAKGEKISCSKLKSHQIPKIKSLYSSGKYTQQEIASKFMVTRKAIGNIINGLVWKHIK